MLCILFLHREMSSIVYDVNKDSMLTSIFRGSFCFLLLENSCLKQCCFLICLGIIVSGINESLLSLPNILTTYPLMLFDRSDRVLSIFLFCFFFPFMMLLRFMLSCRWALSPTSFLLVLIFGATKMIGHNSHIFYYCFLFIHSIKILLQVFYSFFL